MPLTQAQKDLLESIFEAERVRRIEKNLTQTPLVDFASMTQAAQRNFLLGLINAKLADAQRTLDELPTQQAATLAGVRVVVTSLQGLMNDL